jgi:hypothetical protein
MMARSRVLALLSMMCIVAAVAAGDLRCPPEKARRAEEEASALRSWRDVFDSYRRYAECDDGAIAEGYSASVAALLADHWETAPTLCRLTREHARFRRFVLAHIDVTMSPEQAKRIRHSAISSCPKGATSFCRAIVGRLSAR